MRITTGTIVDATIIHAPSSTKNREQKRDPEMHQTKKGKEWYFGMKAHVGVDSKTKLIHSAVATAANVADCDRAAGTAARRRDEGLGRSGVSRADGGDSASARRERRTAPISAIATRTRRRRSGAGEEPDEVAGALEGGARVSE